MAQTKSKARVGEVVDADAALIRQVPELLQTRDESMTVREWIASLIPFFQTAQRLEQTAKDTLEQARRLTLPANKEQDASLQTFIRSASAHKRKVEDHWEITSLLFNFQRRLVAVRKRATDAVDEAAAIAQRLHNQYGEAERRRAEEENRRRQKEADDKAAAEREAELQRLEEMALKAEAGSSDLSDRERRFVELVGSGKAGPTSAAAAAGYKNPAQQAERLMIDKKIIAALDSMKQAAVLREQAAAKRAEPVVPAEIIEEKPQLGGSGVDRTTKSAEITDERLFIEAVVGGRHGIPIDCLMVNPVRMNAYARDMGELINRWPGVRLKKSTKTI